MKGQKNNLYKAIIANIFNLIGIQGFSGIIHPETIYEDPKAFNARSKIYKHLRFHFHFRNGLNLFPEIGHKKSYGINILAGIETSPKFYSIVNLYHPSTIDGCFIHDGQGFSGGMIKQNKEGKTSWNLDPHKNRIIPIPKSELMVFSSIFENDPMKWEGVKLPSLHSKEVLSALKSFNNLGGNYSSYNSEFIIGIDEAQFSKQKIINKMFKSNSERNLNIIYSGPNFYVSNPLNKSSNSKLSFDTVDLNAIDEFWLPTV